MIDAEQLGKGPGVGVKLLGGEYGVTEPGVARQLSRLPERQGRITEEVIDAQQLGESSGFGVNSFQRLRGQLPKLQRRITQQVVDAQKLGECSRIGISGLTGQDRVAQSLVTPMDQLIQQSLVEPMGRAVETQSGR